MKTPQAHTCPDHMVVTAPTLAAGIDWVAQKLGVAPRIGGEHIKLGTHNALLRLGPQFYLEVIAINPAAPPLSPPRARWFGLDRIKADDAPRLAHWVARTDDIHAASAASPIATGLIEEMSRGPLHWLISIAADGSLPMAGLMPSLIQWQAEPHPAQALPELGCSLHTLEIRHPQAVEIHRALQAIGLQQSDPVAQAISIVPDLRIGLHAQILTAGGLRTLD
ncbi:VOC family protein [Herbaspirillum lusitanum]|uniref:VOC family protein n=1 Tax=Herbaspirillum lusitanum TaxID=213312 RepID=A0ABW9ADX0_9BURK